MPGRAAARRLARLLPLSALALALTATGCSSLRDFFNIEIPYVTKPSPAAVARLLDATGNVVGTAVLSQTGGGVRILVDVTGLPPGVKAVHLHEVGRCEAPSFESAGDHVNPTRAEHGTSNPKGPHAGDLPDITVDAGGRGHMEFTNKRITLEKGPTTLIDADGASMVIHERADDNRSDPSGNSGPRLACGVIAPQGKL